MNKLFIYISLGMSAFSLVTTLAVQIKQPVTLDADVVWMEVKPFLMQLGGVINHNIPMVISEKITRSAVAEIKTFYMPKPPVK